MVDKFNPAPDADHFGFITFHNKASVVFTFADSEYHDKDTLLQKIAREPLQLQLQTRTDLALIKARDKLFTGRGGDRPDKPNVIWFSLQTASQLIPESRVISRPLLKI